MRRGDDDEDENENENEDEDEDEEVLRCISQLMLPRRSALPA
jgi:hypothetical protein